MNFKRLKFKVSTRDEAEALLRHLFSLGYTWASGGDGMRNLDRLYFYTERNGSITVGDTLSYWREQPHEEGVPKFVVAVSEIKRSCIEVEGKPMTKAEALVYIDEYFK